MKKYVANRTLDTSITMIYNKVKIYFRNGN